MSRILSSIIDKPLAIKLWRHHNGNRQSFTLEELNRIRKAKEVREDQKRRSMEVHGVRSSKFGDSNPLRSSKMSRHGVFLINDEIADLSEIFRLAGKPLSRDDVQRIAVLGRHVAGRSEPKKYLVTCLLGEKSGSDFYISEFIDRPPYLLRVEDDKEWEDLKDFIEESTLSVDAIGQTYKLTQSELAGPEPDRKIIVGKGT